MADQNYYVQACDRCIDAGHDLEGRDFCDECFDWVVATARREAIEECAQKLQDYGYVFGAEYIRTLLDGEGKDG